MGDGKLRYDDLANLDPQFWTKAIADMNKFFVAAKQGFKDIKEEAKETQKSLSTLSVSDPKQQAEIARLNDKVKELDRLLKGLSTETKRVNATKRKFVELSKQEQIALEETAQKTKKARLEAREAVRTQNSQAGSLERMSVSLSKANRALRLLSVGSEKYKKTLKEVRREQDRYNKELAKAGNSRGFVGNYQRALQGLTAQFSALGAAYTAVRVAQSAFATAKEVDRINKALGVVTTGAAELAQVQDFLSVTAKNYGLELTNLGSSYVKFAAATKGTNLQGEETLKIFDSVSKASAALGLSVENTNGVLNALGQIVSKSKVQAEELRGQLGDRLSGAFKIFADAIGVSTQELDKLLKDGNVLADDTLPKFRVQLLKSFGLESVNAIKTLQGEQNKFANSWTELVTSIEKGSGAISKSFNAISGFFGGLLNKLTDFNESSTALEEEFGLGFFGRLRDVGLFKSLSKFQTSLRGARKEINAITDSNEKAGAIEAQLAKVREGLAKDRARDNRTDQFFAKLREREIVKLLQLQKDQIAIQDKIDLDFSDAEEDRIEALKEQIRLQEKLNKENERAAKIAELRGKQAKSLPTIQAGRVVDPEAAKDTVERTNKLAGEAFEKQRLADKQRQKEQLQEQFEFGQQIANAFIDGLNNRESFRQDFLSRSLAIENDVLAAQLRLIKDGGEANLAATKENQRKLEAERLKSLKRQERLAKLQLLLNLLVAATQAGSNLSQAKGSALTQIKGVAGVGATFGEGGIGHEVFKEQNAISTRGRKQNREGRLVDGIFKGDSHKSKSGGILARVEGDEGIFTTKAMKNLGADTFHSMHNHLNGGHDLSTFLAQEAKVLPVIAQVNNTKELNVIASKLDSVENTIHNKPTQFVSQEVIGNIAFLVNQQTRGNMTKTVKSTGGSLHG